jgi:hypothetical protein
MMKAAKSSETLGKFYLTTRRYNPEDSHLRTHRRKNLKTYKSAKFLPQIIFLQTDKTTSKRTFSLISSYKSIHSERTVNLFDNPKQYQ